MFIGETKIIAHIADRNISTWSPASLSSDLCKLCVASMALRDSIERRW
jgi:hypothetical protein